MDIMASFNTALLREKFTISDPFAKTMQAREPVIALSNRVAIELTTKDKKRTESFAVRAHNMHLAVRATARILQTFENTGPILNRNTPYDWSAAWDSIVNNYEYAYNPGRWIAIYSQGKLVFESGEHHPLLDVIENCQHENQGVYDESITMAEQVVKDAGKDVRISYDGNYALVVDANNTEGRFGIILRGADKKTTFNFSAKVTEKYPKLNIPQCLAVAAAYLEGIQLAFMVGTNNEKIRLGIIPRHSKEEKQTLEARKRLGRLNAEISNLEGSFEVRYRPEKPVLPHIVIDAENRARVVLEAELEEEEASKESSE